MLVVSIAGYTIRYNFMNVCVIDRIEDLNKARAFILKEYGLSFKDEPSVDKKSHKEYRVNDAKADLIMIVKELKYICGDGSH